MFHRKKVLSVSLVGLVLFALIGGAVMMIIVPAVQSAREDARLNQCAKNMYELARAAKQYDDNHA
jgi:hypothetical protein